MRYKVIISERAKEALGLHLRFLAQVSRPAAVQLKKRLLAQLRSLQEMPQRYPFFCERLHPGEQIPQAVCGKLVSRPVSDPRRYSLR